MTDLISVTFDRTSLALSPLVIGTDPTASNFHLSEEGQARRANRVVRRTYAPASAYIPGSYLLAAVEDAGSVPLSIYVHGDDIEDLEAAMTELEQATSQFAYQLTLTVNGAPHIYAADPELPQWSGFDSGVVKARIAIASIVIPVNPA